MKLFLKLVVLAVLLVMLSYWWPLLLIPAGALTLVLCSAGSIFVGGLTTVLGLACAIGSVLVGLALVCGLLVAPIAVPVLIVVGICSLLRRSRPRSVAGA
jgi:hypothetical protein